jgi:hypothetical protein
MELDRVNYLRFECIKLTLKQVSIIDKDGGKNQPLIKMIFLTFCACISDADGWADVKRRGNGNYRTIKSDRIRP